MKSSQNTPTAEYAVPRWIEALQEQVPLPPVPSAKLMAKGVFWTCFLVSVIELESVLNRTHGMRPHVMLLVLVGLGLVVSAAVILQSSRWSHEDSSITYKRLTEQMALSKALEGSWTESMLDALKAHVAFEHARIREKWECRKRNPSRLEALAIALFSAHRSREKMGESPPEMRFLELLTEKVERMIHEQQRKRKLDEQRQIDLAQQAKQREQQTLLGEKAWNYRLAMIAKIERVAERSFWEWTDIKDLLRSAGFRAIELATHKAIQSEASTREIVWRQCWEDQWQAAIDAATEAMDQCKKHVRLCDDARRFEIAFVEKQDQLSTVEKEELISKAKLIEERLKKQNAAAERATQRLRQLAAVEAH